MLELYHNDMSSCAQKVRCQLAEKNIDWQSHELNLRQGDQHRPEFLALNPKGVVPVIVHDGKVVCESNIIMEYIEDSFDTKTRLMPTSPIGRARARAWLQRLDSGLHLAIATISIGIAFRHQVIAVNPTPESQKAFVDAIPDPALRSIYREVVPLGHDAPAFVGALKAWAKCMGEMDAALQSSNWLVDNTLSLADFGMLPYLCRLEHLRLEAGWSDLPSLSAWFERIKTTTGYRMGIEKWLNSNYLKLMAEQGDRIAKSVSHIFK